MWRRPQHLSALSPLSPLPRCHRRRPLCDPRHRMGHRCRIGVSSRYPLLCRLRVCPRIWHGHSIVWPCVRGAMVSIGRQWWRYYPAIRHVRRAMLEVRCVVQHRCSLRSCHRRHQLCHRQCISHRGMGRSRKQLLSLLGGAGYRQQHHHLWRIWSRRSIARCLQKHRCLLRRR